MFSLKRKDASKPLCVWKLLVYNRIGFACCTVRSICPHFLSNSGVRLKSMPWPVSTLSSASNDFSGLSRRMSFVYFFFTPGHDSRSAVFGSMEDVSRNIDVLHFFVLFFIRAIFKLYICIPTNCTQLIYFINNTLKHMYCLKL